MSNRVIGITRVRNEEHIIMGCLDNAAYHCDGIVVLDDASTDRTLELVHSHPIVIEVIENKIWEDDPTIRLQLEGLHRSQAYNVAMGFLPSWIYVFDADEFADFENVDLDNPNIDAYKMRLWDFYITPGDKDLPWSQRDYIGPEYRDILTLFRPHPKIRFTSRVPKLPINYRVEQAGKIKHYGKAISIDEWEKTCYYYSYHLAERGISRKWKGRVGKAIHTKSDFGKPLITWEEAEEKGIPLIDNQI
jgi:glycosyltransferase involved in cell wall biosynthesis